MFNDIKTNENRTTNTSNVRIRQMKEISLSYITKALFDAKKLKKYTTFVAKST